MRTEPMAPPHETFGPDDDAIKRRALARVGVVLRGKWRIDRLLGVGGMAAVYEGTHRNGKRGAIKLLHLELSTDPEARARFLKEGYVANKVAHPGAVSVLDDDMAEDGSVFLVMELLEGKSVGDIADARPGGRMRVGESLRLVDELLDVLAAAHAKGVVHRDLKPENLFLTNDGTLKVLDFGLARVMETQSAAKMTKTGNAMGTPAFMPPEQALGNWSQVDARSDLWAVGASLFTLLSGRLVHEAPTLNQLLLKAMTQPAPPIRDVLPGLPADVAEVVDRALAFQQKDRWPDAAAMQRAVRKAIATIDASGEPALEPVTRGSGAVAGADSMMATLVRDPASAPPSRSSRRGILAGLAALMVLGSGVALAAFSGVKLAPSTVVAAAQPPPMPSEAPAVTPAPVPSTVETRPAAQTSPTTSSIAAAPPPSARPATSTSKGRNPFKGFH